MTDSFVFYKSFYNSICLLPTDTEKWEAVRNMCELAFHDVEADLSDTSDLVKIIYTVTEQQIKASVQHKLDGLKGGRPRKSNSETMVKTPLKTPLSDGVKSNVNVNDNVNVNVNDNVNNRAEIAMDVTPIQENYSKQVFAIWQEAEMPGSKDIFKFTSREFKNALGTLKGYHSDEVLGAVKNYIDIYKNEATWVTKALTFDKFVSSKLFSDCLPDNFVLDNFLKDTTAKTLQMPETPKKQYVRKTCPHCQAFNKLWFNEKKQKYICDACKTNFEWEKIAYLEWEDVHNG